MKDKTKSESDRVGSRPNEAKLWRNGVKQQARMIKTMERESLIGTP